MTPNLRRLIDALAAFYQVPPFAWEGETYSGAELLEAIVLAESNGDCYARRYEARPDRSGRADAATDSDRPGIDDGSAEDDASYGLMQVMGFNWRRLVGAPPGSPLRFDALFDAGLGLWAGIQVLAEELAALYREDPHLPEAARVARALACYNGGPTGDDLVGGQMRLQAYVQRVAAAAARARADRRACGWVGEIRA